MTLALLFASCGDDLSVSPIPQIEFLGLSKDTMIQGPISGDTVEIAISFTDGDGDLNNDNHDIGASIFVKDLRTNELHQKYFLPNIPSKGAVSGEIFIKLLTTCCIFPDNIPPCDSPIGFPTNDLDLEIALIDAAGNRSNLIKTPTITLLCD